MWILFLLLGILVMTAGTIAAIVTTIVFCIKNKKILMPAICIPSAFFGGIVFIFLGAILSPPSNNNAENKQETQKIESSNELIEEKNDAEDEEISENSNVVKVGESFETSRFRITVNEADTDFKDYDNEYGWNTPEDGMKYVMVSFTFENISDEGDAYVSIYDFDCYADNAVCDQTYSLDDSDFMNANISPSRNVSFKTYYVVPIDSESIELEYETNMWTSEKKIIKIQ